MAPVRSGMVSMRTVIAVLAGGVVALGPASSRAMVMEALSVPEMSRTADLVVRGVVVATASRYEDAPGSHRIVTDVTVRVSERVVGRESGPDVVVTTLGGVVERHGQVVPGSPRFQVGEEVVVFLHPPRVTSVGPRRAVVGLAQGVFHVTRASPAARAVARQSLRGIAFPKGDVVDPGDVDLDDLLRAVRSEAAAPQGPR